MANGTSINENDRLYRDFCLQPASKQGSKDLAITFLLYHLNITTLLIVLIQNTVTYRVLQARVKKRPETNFLYFFCVVNVIDVLFGGVALIRDTVLLWSRGLEKGHPAFYGLYIYRYIEGALLCMRSFITMIIVIYHILVFLSMQRAEKLSKKFTLSCFFGLLVAGASVLGDHFSHKVLPCGKCCDILIR